MKGVCSRHSLGAATKQIGKSISEGSSSGYSVEYKEKDIERIPAHSSKSFGEFTLSNGVYRECGLARNPRAKEMAVKEFNENTSPLVFRNNFVFIIDGHRIPVTNEFYVSHIRNINEKEVFEELQVYDCNGIAIRQNHPVKFNKYASGNKYFISYSLDRYSQNDRIRKR